MDKTVFFSGEYIIFLLKSVCRGVYMEYLFCVEMYYYIMWRCSVFSCGLLLSMLFYVIFTSNFYILRFTLYAIS
jgi:hypothetical protein